MMSEGVRSEYSSIKLLLLSPENCVNVKGEPLMLLAL
jgi:hypothetical protein